LAWCKTKIKKLEKPDCPSCRVLFEPEKRSEVRKIESIEEELKVEQP
jgi:hypothetical protein